MDTCRCTHLVYQHRTRSRRCRSFPAECASAGCGCVRFEADPKTGRPIEPILTPAQVGAYLRVTPATVKHWAHAGNIEAILTHGGHRRYRLSEVQRVCQSGPGRDPAAQELLTPGEFASRVGRHPKTVTKWANAGKVSYVRTAGNHKRFPASELARILPHDTEKEIGAGEFARQAGLHPKKLQRLANAGKVVSHRVAGGHRRFPISEVARLRAEANQVEANA